MGDSCAQGGKPGIKETGTPEDVPRTAAITHAAGIKKAPADVMGALLRLELHGFPHPVAELAATVGGYRAVPFPATFESAGDYVAGHRGYSGDEEMAGWKEMYLRHETH
ncbi:hypothetical protein ACYZTM_09535 [Pseudomonas sp. MDT2-39-1]